MGLPQDSDAVRTLDEVIQRAKQQHRIPGVVSLIQRTGITNGHREPSSGARLVHVQRNRVDQVYVMAQIDQPGRVHARTAADVEHICRRAWKEAFQQHLCPDQLQRGQLGQASLLRATVVVRLNLRIKFHATNASPR